MGAEWQSVKRLCRMLWCSQPGVCGGKLISASRGSAVSDSRSPYLWENKKIDHILFINPGNCGFGGGKSYIESIVAGGADEQPAGGLSLFTEYGVEPVTVSADRADSEFIRHLYLLDVVIHLYHLERFQEGG